MPNNNSNSSISRLLNSAKEYASAAVIGCIPTVAPVAGLLLIIAALVADPENSVPLITSGAATCLLTLCAGKMYHNSESSSEEDPTQSGTTAFFPPPNDNESTASPSSSQFTLTDSTATNSSDSDPDDDEPIGSPRENAPLSSLRTRPPSHSC